MKPLVFAIVALVLAPAALRAEPAAAPTAPAERYALGLIWKGPAWTPERSAHTDSLQAGHMANIRRMFEAGALIAAGPCDGDPTLRGIFVWRADSLEGVPRMLAGDPSVREGRLRVALHRWYAAPGIGDEYRARHAQDPGARDSMVTFALVLLRRGPSYTSNLTPKVQRVLAAHARHAEQMRREGALVLGGSIEGLGDPRGLLVFAADTARVRRLLADDPAVKSGRFVPQICEWWTARGNVPGH